MHIPNLFKLGTPSPREKGGNVNLRISPKTRFSKRLTFFFFKLGFSLLKVFRPEFPNLFFIKNKPCQPSSFEFLLLRQNE